MCPRTSQQFESIRQEKTKLILDTALELFAEKGYHQTSISDITQRAGISKGLLYNYFESKDQVLRSIIQTGYNAAYDNLDLNGDHTLAKEEFIHFLRITFQSVRENPRFWKLYSALVLQPGIQDMVMTEYNGKAQDIRKLFLDFIRVSGSIDPDNDFIAISSLIKGANLILITAPDFFQTGQFEETIIDACFRLIQKGAEDSRSIQSQKAMQNELP
jgi:AcrR family transcriptional regulator